MYFRFKQKNFKSLLQEFGMAVGVPVTKNSLQFPIEFGHGFCMADNIDKSFSFALINAVLKDTVTFNRISNKKAGTVVFFNLVDTKDGIRIYMNNEVVHDCTFCNHKNIFITSSNTDFQISFSAGTIMKQLVIYLSPQWTDENLNCTAKQQLQLITTRKLQPVNELMINGETENMLNCIFKTRITNEEEKLLLKNKVILLLAHLFNSNLNLPVEISKKKTIPEDDIVRLKKIETLLKDDEIDKFPTILNLAKIAHMSGTKLKMKFKQVYGYRLYEFYNKQRLEKAKLLIEKGTTSKEAAYSIGFNDVSNFTKAFKKEYGYTPGRIFDKPMA